MPGTGNNRTVFEVASRPPRSLYRIASRCSPRRDTSASPQMPHLASLCMTPLAMPVAGAHSRPKPSHWRVHGTLGTLGPVAIISWYNVPPLHHGSRPRSPRTFVATSLGWSPLSWERSRNSMPHWTSPPRDPAAVSKSHLSTEALNFSEQALCILKCGLSSLFEVQAVFFAYSCSLFGSNRFECGKLFSENSVRFSAQLVGN